MIPRVKQTEVVHAPTSSFCIHRIGRLCSIPIVALSFSCKERDGSRHFSILSCRIKCGGIGSVDHFGDYPKPCDLSLQNDRPILCLRFPLASQWIRLGGDQSFSWPSRRYFTKSRRSSEVARLLEISSWFGKCKPTRRQELRQHGGWLSTSKS